MPAVSVVIPTHNRANLIGTAITSVLNQTFQDFEIIVVDDASTDATAGVIEGYRARGVRYLRQQVNRGDAATRNAGVAAARGTYVAFLDDDDEWLPAKLQRQMEFMSCASPEVAGVHTGRFIIERRSGRSFVPPPPHGWDKETQITTSAFAVRRCCLMEVGAFDEGNPHSSDFDMWIRLSQRFRLAYIDEPLVKTYIQWPRLSTNYAKVIAGKERILKQHGAALAVDPKSYCQHYLTLGVMYCFAGNMRKGRSVLREGIRIYPMEPRNYFNLMLALMGPKAFTALKGWKESFTERRRRRNVVTSVASPTAPPAGSRKIHAE